MTLERDDNWDQPPGVDVHDNAKRYPPANEAAERILEFVRWWGDGDIASEMEDAPPLYARDLCITADTILHVPSKGSPA